MFPIYISRCYIHVSNNTTSVLKHCVGSSTSIAQTTIQCCNHRGPGGPRPPQKIWTLKIFSSKFFALLFHRFSTKSFCKEDVKEAYLSHSRGWKMENFPNHGGASLVTIPYLNRAPLISWLRHFYWVKILFWPISLNKNFLSWYNFKM